MAQSGDQQESALSHPPDARPLREWLLAAVIVAAALLACLPVFRGGFFWDDSMLAVNNPLVRAPDGLRKIWSTTEQPEYLPLTFTMHWAEWRLWGRRAAGYHVVNVLFHAAAAVLLWRVLARLKIPGPFDPAQRDRPEGNRMGGAWLAGLLFAVHPVTVASAAWISERKNTLSMALYLLSLLMYLKFDNGVGDSEIGKLGDWEIGKLPGMGRLKKEPCHSRESGNPETRTENVDSPRMRGGNDATQVRNEVSAPPASFSAAPTVPNLPISQSPNLQLPQSPNLLISQSPTLSRSAGSPRLHGYVASIILFLLALLAKTSVVMLPVILLLCAWWRRGRISRKDLLRSLPFFGLSLILGLVTVWFQQHHAIHGEIVRPEGLASRVAAAGWIAWFYLFKILLPVGLCVLYPRWSVDGSSPAAFLPLALLAAGLAWAWLHRKGRGRAPLFAAAYFLISLLPVLGFADMSFARYSFVADHLQYVAMAGVIAFAAAVLYSTPAPGCEMSSRRFDHAHGGPEQRRMGRGRLGHIVPAPMLLTAACVAVLAILTWQRAALYAGETRLWRENVAKNPAAWLAWNSLGAASVTAGRPDEALRCFDKAIQLNPNFAEGRFNRGAVYDEAGRTADALREYDHAIALKPDYAAAFSNRGNLCRRIGRSAQAFEDYDSAIRCNPEFAPAWYNRAKANADAGQTSDALRDYAQAILLNPHYADAWYNRANLYARLGKYGLALSDYGRAILLNPAHALAYNNRGNVFFQVGRYEMAVSDYSRLIQLKPDYAEGFLNRGRAYARIGRDDLALADCGRAIALKPDLAASYYERAVILHRLKEYGKALEDVKTFQKLGGRPDAGFLKDLTEALGGADRKE